MKVLPAIDIRDGAVVQLVGGDYEAERIRVPDPVAVSRRWAAAGLQEQHVVDLDAATGRGHNREALKALAQEPGLVLQVGGGLRDDDAVAQVLELGVARVVVGTRAIEDPAWLERLAGRYPRRVVLAADVRGRDVVVRGWTVGAQLTLEELLQRVEALPLAGVLVTAVHVEGQLQGIDETVFQAAVAVSRAPLYASGGITTLGDLEVLRRLGVTGAVVGMALYTERLEPTQVARWQSGHAAPRPPPPGFGVAAGAPPSPAALVPPLPAGRALVRQTRESRVSVALGTQVRVSTGKPFLDHMLTTFSRYSGLTLQLEARGDLTHHLLEDVALTLGAFVRRQAPAACARYGERTVPMDDALVQAVVDVGGRPYFRGQLPNPLYTHWFRSFATASESALHLRVLRQGDRHHVLEAAFKATGLALRQALQPQGQEVFSTKGTVAWREEDV